MTCPPHPFPSTPTSRPGRASCSPGRAICPLGRILGLSLLLSLAHPGLANDWMGFRGTSGTGCSQEPDLALDLQDGQSLAWKIDLPGRGLSSPIIIGDRIFLTCATGPRQERLQVLCLSAADGSLLWERRFWATGRTMSHPKTCVAAPTPVSDGQRLWALFSCGDLLCLDLEGNLLWLRGLGRDYPNASNSLGMASSPALAGTTLILQLEADSESFAAGLDILTGVNRWKSPRPKVANWSSPQVLTDPDTGQTIALLQSTAGLLAVDPSTGRELWSYQEGADPIASSVVGPGLIVVPSHGLTALPARPQSQTAPEQLWRSGQLRPATASPLIWQDRVLILNGAGVLTCGDLASGERLWQARLKGPFAASPVAAGPFLYCVNEKGLLQTVDLRTTEGTLVSELDLQQTILATPAIAHRALYLRSDAHLWKFQNPSTVKR